MSFIWFTVYVIFAITSFQPITCDTPIVAPSTAKPISHSNLQTGETVANKMVSQSKVNYSEGGSIVDKSKPETTIPDTKSKVLSGNSSLSAHSRGVTNTSNFPSQLDKPSNLNQSKELPLAATKLNVNKSQNSETNLNKSAVNSTSTQIGQKTDGQTKPSNSSSSINKQTNAPKPAAIIPTTKPALKTSTTTIAPTTTKAPTKKPTEAVPKKPTRTYSVEDVPGLLDEVQKESSVPEMRNDDNEPRILQSSETINDRASGHDYLVPVIALIFMIPFFVIFANCAVRCGRDYWSKRKYRRMDYLIEDMYN